MEEKKKGTSGIFIEGVPLQTYLNQFEEKERGQYARTELRQTTKQALYAKPTARHATPSSPGRTKVRFLAREEIMKEELSYVMPRLTNTTQRVIAILRAGHKLSVEQAAAVVSSYQTQDSSTLPTNTIASAIGRIKKSKIAPLLNETTQGRTIFYSMQPVAQQIKLDDLLILANNRRNKKKGLSLETLIEKAVGSENRNKEIQSKNKKELEIQPAEILNEEPGGFDSLINRMINKGVTVTIQFSKP